MRWLWWGSLVLMGACGTAEKAPPPEIVSVLIPASPSLPRTAPPDSVSAPVPEEDLNSVSEPQLESSAAPVPSPMSVQELHRVVDTASVRVEALRRYLEDRPQYARDPSAQAPIAQYEVDGAPHGPEAHPSP